MKTGSSMCGATFTFATQRQHISFEVRRPMGFTALQIVWIEEMIEGAGWSASAPEYALLGSCDRWHAAMSEYGSPAVSNIMRNVAVALQRDPRVRWFWTQAVNGE